MSTCTTKKQTRTEDDETEEIRVDVPLMEITHQNEETYFFSA